jgi:hypothetical protein
VSKPSTADSHTGYAIIYGSLIRVISPWFICLITDI